MRSTCPNLSARVRGLIILSICLILATSTGCKPTPPPSTPTATLPPTSTPEPTATATPVPTNTPTLTATPDRKATLMAGKTATMTARVAELSSDLESVGFNTDLGSLVYDEDISAALSLDSYNSYWPEPFITTPLKDFILHVDVLWDSTSGLAGCGIVFRAEEDLERGAQYIIDLMRLSGAPNWEILYRKFNNTQTYLIEPQFDSVIDDDPMSNNNVMLVVKGDLVQAYINGKKMREVHHSKLTEGGLAFLIWQESGETTCIFSNAWVWELPSEAANPST